MIPFNKPPYTGNEDAHVAAAMQGRKLSGDGDYTRRCEDWFRDRLGAAAALVTPSCTHALEMAALLLDIQPGDEVIMPSYTFVSTANAFVLRGAIAVFVDVRPDTMNIDETLIEAAITDRTRAIVPVHYAGVACAMDEVMAVANRHGLAVVEDAAQGMLAMYRNRPLGTIGDFGAYSFHESKNFTSGGEGGLFIARQRAAADRAEIIREKGTNRSEFFRGRVDKYTWMDIGSSYLPSELQSAYLWGQLEAAQSIQQNRLDTWARYFEELAVLAEHGDIVLPTVPDECAHNAHMFYLKVSDLAERARLISHLADAGAHAVFHYVPLHSTAAGRRFGRFHGEDRYTTAESERLLRLPLWYGMPPEQAGRVVAAVTGFF